MHLVRSLLLAMLCRLPTARFISRHRDIRNMLLSATSRQTASADSSVLKALSHVQLKLSRCYKLLRTPVTNVELRLISRYLNNLLFHWQFWQFSRYLGYFGLFSVLLCCWLGDGKGAWSAKVLPHPFPKRTERTSCL